MNMVQVVGIDPGLVDTGVVKLEFLPTTRTVRSRSLLIPSERVPLNESVETARVWCMGGLQHPATAHVFIEGYKPRSNFGTDVKMIQAVAAYHAGLPGSKVLLNHGVKRVVKKPLMDLLEVWSFHTSSHHQDLRSAARIALLGMLKDERLNYLLSDIVRDHLQGKPWDIKSNR